MKIILENRP